MTKNSNSKDVRRWVVYSIAAVLALAVVVYWRMSSETSASPPRDRTPVKVAMKWEFAGTMAPYFAAKTNGVFDNLKLSVELIPGGATRPAVEQVLFGKASFGIAGAHDLALARAKQQPVVSIAVIFRESPTCLLSLAESRIRSPEDLKGKIVEMTVGDNSDFEYRAMLQRRGILLSEVDTRKWSFSYDLLLAGKVAATVAYENDQAISLARQHKVSVMAPRKFGVAPYADVLFTTEDVIRNQPELAGTVVFGFLAAWERAALNPQDAVDRFLKDPAVEHLNLDRDTQLSVVKKSIEFVRGSSGAPDVGEHIQGIGIQALPKWEETVSLIEKYGDSDRLPKPEECYTNRWTELYALSKTRDNRK